MIASRYSPPESRNGLYMPTSAHEQLKEHDLAAFMRSLQDQMSNEYARIQSRVGEDPGTAGDQGEENWATLLRNWLPATYPVVTKGRILGASGEASPQVDVLVLRPDYPLHLRDKKTYLAGGVVAAFECKLTLRPAHLPKIVESCKSIKSMSETRTGTPYRELQREIAFGVLAHSHTWSAGEDTVYFRLLESLENAIFDRVEHPWQIPDVVCVADLVTCVATKSLAVFPHVNDDHRELFEADDRVGGPVTCYMMSRNLDATQRSRGEVMGALVEHLTRLMAKENAALRTYATYFQRSLFVGGLGRPVGWSSDAFSPPVLERIQREGYSDDLWSDWAEYVV